MVRDGRVAWFKRAAGVRDVEGKDIVVNFEENLEVKEAANEKNILYIDASSNLVPSSISDITSDHLFEELLKARPKSLSDSAYGSDISLPTFFAAATSISPPPSVELENDLVTIDGAEAVSNVVYALSDIAFVYPVSENVGQSMITWSEDSKLNLVDKVPKIVKMTTNVASGNTIIGALKPGLNTNVLMSSAALGHLLPSMFGLPHTAHPVFHVASHIAHDLVIDHGNDQIQQAAQTGFTIIAGTNVQESQDLAIITHLVAKYSETPAFHFFDGAIQTSQKGSLRGFEKDQISRIAEITDNLHGSSSELFGEVCGAFREVFGRGYEGLEYIGSPNATVVLVSMGIGAAVISQAIRRLAQAGHKVGCVVVRLYRPWALHTFLSMIPTSATKVVVVDQGANEASLSPLAIDVEASFYGIPKSPVVVNGGFAKGLEHLHAGAVETFVLAHLNGQVPEVIRWDGGEEIGQKGVISAIVWDKKAESTFDALSLIAEDIGVVAPFQQSFVQHLSTSIEPAFVTHLRLGSVEIIEKTLVHGADVLFCNSLDVVEGFNFAGAIRRNGKLFVNTSLNEKELFSLFSPQVQADLHSRNISIFSLDATLIASNYTIFYGSAKYYLTEILAAVFYRLAYPSEAQFLLAAQDDRISTLGNNVRISLKESILLAIGQVAALSRIPKPESVSLEHIAVFPQGTVHSNTLFSSQEPSSDIVLRAAHKNEALLPIIFPSAFNISKKFRPDLENVFTVKVTENIRITPDSYERNVFHMEFDITGTGMKYEIGNALGIYPRNEASRVDEFLLSQNLNGKQIVFIDRPDTDGNTTSELRSLVQLFTQTLDIFGKPGKKFYQYLAAKSTDMPEKERIAALLETSESFDEYVNAFTPTYADLLNAYPSANLSVEELIRVIPAIKPRLYSISSSQRAHPNSVHLLVVLVDWVSDDSVQRYGAATNYLVNSKMGDSMVVTLKPSVMKLPTSLESPVIMSGLGTGMAPFRAFIEERMYWKRMGKKVGPMSLYFGSRNRANEFLYGEELEAYHTEGILTNLRVAFSRDQKEKIYIQHRIEEDGEELHKLIVEQGGSFYLCGPTWPVPDVTDALLKSFGRSMSNEKSLEFIEVLKNEERFVLEVY